MKIISGEEQHKVKVISFYPKRYGLNPILSIRVLLPSFKEYSILTNGQVQFGLEKSSTVFGQFPLLSSSDKIVMHIWNFPSSENNAYFDIPLTSNIIECIEKSRKGGNIYFSGKIHAIIFTIEEDKKTIKGMWWSSFNIKGIDKDEIELPQSKWIEICSELKVFDKHILEITAPYPSNEPKLRKVASYIIKAGENYRNFDHDQVLVNCRKSLEALQKKFNNFQNISNFEGFSKKRFKKLLEFKDKLHELTHKGAHHRDESPISREESRLILVSTQLWISFIENCIFKSNEY